MAAATREGTELDWRASPLVLALLAAILASTVLLYVQVSASDEFRLDLTVKGGDGPDGQNLQGEAEYESRQHGQDHVMAPLLASAAVAASAGGVLAWFARSAPARPLMGFVFCSLFLLTQFAPMAMEPSVEPSAEAGSFRFHAEVAAGPTLLRAVKVTPIAFVLYLGLAVLGALFAAAAACPDRLPPRLRNPLAGPPAPRAKGKRFNLHLDTER